MTAKPKIKTDGRTITVRVPIAIRKRGGRKIILAQDGTQHDPGRLICQQPDNAMVKAIARAFRWRAMLESGAHATISEIAEAEKINESYVGRVLRLTLLAPDIVESIVGGSHPPRVNLSVLMKHFPPIWQSQRSIFVFKR